MPNPIRQRPPSGQLRQRRPAVRARPRPRRLSIEERERLLDEALLESFPASDPVSSLEFS